MADLSTALPAEHARLHICALLDDASESAAVGPRFVRDALAEGQQVLAIAGSAALQRLREGLSALAPPVAVPPSASTSQLRLLPWTEMAPSPRGFDRDVARIAVDALLAEAAGEHCYRGVRLLQDMDWVVTATSAGHELAGYERDVDQLVKQYGPHTVCVYDLSRLSGALLLELLTSHPFALLRGQLVESPFYSEPA